MARTVVIGVGNDYRGDDGAGPAVVRLLRGLGVSAVGNGGDPAELIEAWTGAAVAVVIDAARSGDRPGTVRRHAGLRGLPERTASTHALSLADAVALGRALGRLPGELVVYTVEGEGFALGAGLSPPVLASVPRVAEAVLGECAGLRA
ncbi:hydrogenase maturation protease [Nonomuraea harbinensis]|uniref:Hydrogenase maturation protease n=1 Tax=Nonomuraea harbinensis TaxID=1286938 RepID=A0ABW1C9V8_9ACTN|nr:hydrogenase maturation protease [Nonomuraea harbinensis]